MGYVESGYSQGYVEGDNPSESVSCDLTKVNKELELIKAQNEALKVQNSEILTLLSTIVDSVNTNKTIGLSVSNAIANQNDVMSTLATREDIQNIPKTDISALATKEFIENSVPFVDDMSILAHPKGTKMDVAGVDGFCVIESSKFLPQDEFTFVIVYTVSYMKDGVLYISDFPAFRCVPYVEDE